jgi:isoquinoline 1-oxidoreductase subunit beta
VEYALAHSGVPRAWWRSVEHSSSGFVVETFVDELAAAAGADPLKFRLELIGDARKIPDFTNPKENKPLDTARLKGVLQLAAEKAQWGKPLPKGVARGIAGYFSFESYTAAVAEVSVEKGQVNIHRIVYAVDCGRPVNPAGVVAQVESAAVYALSAMMKDAITIERGRVKQANFNDYDMPRMREMPKIEVHVIMSKEDPTGIGEPGLPVVAPAIGNAVFAATGKRLRRLPIQPADLA